MKCEFCVLKPLEERNRSYFDQESGMVSYKMEGKKKYGYFDACSDGYYSTIVIRDMKYCPMCGRKLDEE